MDYDNLSSAFTALGDPMRRELVQRLAKGPRSVGELAQGVPISRPAVSQHLRHLKDAGLVSDEAVGTRRIYRLDPGGLVRCVIGSISTGKSRWAISSDLPIGWRKTRRRRT